MIPMPKGMPLCKICKEPIWGFFCLDCLAEGINSIIPGHIREGFRSFQTFFTHHFNNFTDTTFEYCLNCKALKESVVCPYCYINESLNWISENHPHTGSSLKGKFSLRLLNRETSGFDEFFINTRLVPIKRTRCSPADRGLCERCEQYSEDLRFSDGRWVCENCRYN